MKSLVILIAASILCMSATIARADDICADRPAKALSPCTVSPGNFQLETDGINITSQRMSATSTTTVLAPNPTLKYGLSPNSDIEFNIGNEIMGTRTTGVTSSVTGISDLYVRMKFEVLNQTKLQIAISPWIKIPTADRSIGNGAFESGITLPVEYVINDKWTVTYVQDIDSLKNSGISGYHTNTAETVSVGRALPHNLSLALELWSEYNDDPLQREQQYSMDTALSWVKNNLEYDVGVNFGLNKETPQSQVYMGFSDRF